MIVNDLFNTLRQMKQKNPVFDFSQFKLTVDGYDIAKIEVDGERYGLNIVSTGAVERATKEDPGEDYEGIE